MTLNDFYSLLITLMVSCLYFLQLLEKMSQFLPASVVGWRSNHILDSAWRSTWKNSLYFETIASQMSCTLTAIVKTLAIDLYFELGFSIKMVDACSSRHRGSSFGDSPTVGHRWRTDVRIDTILLCILMFLIDLFELILVVPLGVFLVEISLPDGRIVDIIFIGHRSDYLSEEGLLNIFDSIHNC